MRSRVGVFSFAVARQPKSPFFLTETLNRREKVENTSRIDPFRSGSASPVTDVARCPLKLKIPKLDPRRLFSALGQVDLRS